MSIFNRDCPECAAPNRPGTVMCACGYCFDPDALAEADPVAYARQQDRLYLDYLRARLARAETDAAAARTAARAEPGNKQRAMAARAAEASLAKLRTELEQWSRRVPAPPSRPAAAAPDARARPPQRREQPRAAASPATPRPGASFRRAQAERAQAAFESRRSVTAAAPRVAPTAAPSAAARRSVSAGPRGATRECPNCTARVPVDTPRCRCGYAFPRPGDEVPALALDAAALAILAEDITLTGSNRRR